MGVVSGRCGGFGSGCGFGDDWVVDLGVDFREEKDRERERERIKNNKERMKIEYLKEVLKKK